MSDTGEVPDCKQATVLSFYSLQVQIGVIWWEMHKLGMDDWLVGPAQSMYYQNIRVPTGSGNHGKPGKSLKKVPCMEKSWNLKKSEKSWKMKPTVARKLAVGHLCVRQLVFWLLVVSSFNYFQIHAWSTSMLLLLHSTLCSAW